jgi:hypothetical protein
VAALVGIFAVLTHSFDRTDARLIGTSLGFAVFSALGAAGGAARRRPGLEIVGVLTSTGATLSFALLILAAWLDQTNWTWRAFGFIAVLTLAGSHASLVLKARRAGDPPLIANLTVISVLTASIDAVLAALAIAGLFHDISSGEIRFVAVLIIAMLLSTALPPILRRARESRDTTTAQSAISTPPSEGSSAELLAIARRLENLAPQAGTVAHQIERETIRLRELANTPLRR